LAPYSHYQLQGSQKSNTISMKIENPLAFSFIMPDELYLLKKDKELSNTISIPQPVLETPPVNFNYRGLYKKNFLVVVYYPDLEFINDKHLTALQSILNRLEFNLDDVAIFNKAKYSEASSEHLTDFFKPEKLLILGKHALPKAIAPLTLNKLQPLNNCSTLFSFSFEEMMDNNENKKAFWEQMKQL
jgi:hypothetical protein